MPKSHPVSAVSTLCTALSLVTDGLQAGVGGLPRDQRRAFAGWLLNRLFFLKCVEQRGWLDNDRDYLYARFQPSPRNYWQEQLVPLLWGTPGNNGNQTGWLLSAEFRVISAEWNIHQVTLAADSLSLLFEHLLNRYDFTLAPPGQPDRSSPGQSFPDMLAYACEQLIVDRHGQGAYYTHPAEVNLMCRESLRAYLEQRCPEIAPASITALVYAEPGMPPPPAAQALQLYTALHDITVCDPAAGSGIFLVAMLRHLAHSMRRLGQFLADYPPFREAIAVAGLTDPQAGFDLVTHILGQSIYGSDIDPTAIELARLRCRLELLAVCEHPRPLPNLAGNLPAGEALGSPVSVDARGTLQRLDLHSGQAVAAPDTAGMLRRLIDLKRRSFTAYDPHVYCSLNAELTDLRTQILQHLGGAGTSEPDDDRYIHWPVDAAAFFQRASPGYDIVIGNPPYLRQELIDPAYTTAGLPTRKRDLQRLYQAMTGYKIRGTADLYVFFFLRGLMLARQHGGTLCYICSNAWLDVAYGAVIQRAILERTTHCTIFDTRAERSFAPAAAVNTAITLLQTGAGSRSPRQTATFVLFRTGFAQVNDWRTPAQTDTGDATTRTTVTTVAYADLAQVGGGSGNWGGRYLRSPDIYRQIMEKCRARLVPLQAIADLRFGIKTGANPFFHLSRATSAAWGIEPDYLKPLLRRPRECRSILVEPEGLTCHLLVCNVDWADLTGTRVLDYIAWGERMRFHERPSCRVRARWYALGTQPPADFIALRFREQHHWTPLLRAVDIAVGDTVFVGRFHDRRLVDVGGALLNSTLFVLMSEVYGRANLGDGLLTTYGPEILKLPLVDPMLALDRAAELTAALQQLAARKTRPILEEIQQPDRHALDAIVCALLGLTSGEQEAVYAAVQDLVLARLHKAKN
ncbi:MAG: Eco57I restriction-modification methylase domain-containing protein [Chloroflexaceae bacterium]